MRNASPLIDRYDIWTCLLAAKLVTHREGGERNSNTIFERTFDKYTAFIYLEIDIRYK